MHPDSHGIDGCYTITSLYFDTPCDRALRDKLDGISRREKFRIRYYNNDTDFILLEKKSKQAGLGGKQKAVISAAEVQQLMDGQNDFLRRSDNELMRELYLKMTTVGLRPKTVVEYMRRAYVYAPGNTRVTIDRDIRTAIGCKNFLLPRSNLLPAAGDPIILEVKWDTFLPSVIRDAVQLGYRRSAPYSKYAACRIYG